MRSTTCLEEAKLPMGTVSPSPRESCCANESLKDYLRCDIPLSLAFTFNGKQYPAHPLDMSDYSPTDTSHKTCLGQIQYTPGLTAGDV